MRRYSNDDQFLARTIHEINRHDVKNPVRGPQVQVRNSTTT
jgi:hypothetical protein